MRRRPPPPPTRTTWHPLFIRNLRRAFPRPHYQIYSEWCLSQEPEPPLKGLSHEEFMDAIVQLVPPERRLKGLTLGQRLEGLSEQEVDRFLSLFVESLSPEGREQAIRILQSASAASKS